MTRSSDTPAPAWLRDLSSGILAAGIAHRALLESRISRTARQQYKRDLQARLQRQVSMPAAWFSYRILRFFGERAMS